MQTLQPTPEEAAALNDLFAAYQRLKALGWNDAVYCPKDGTKFAAIEAGSTGVHLADYQGEWPSGGWWVYDGDIWPSRPILFKPLGSRLSPVPAPLRAATRSALGEAWRTKYVTNNSLLGGATWSRTTTRRGTLATLR